MCLGDETVSMKHAYLISFMLLSVAISLTIGFSPCPADEIRSQGIRLDGTFGATGKPDLPGPDFDIPAEYGKQIGSNLFHSFARFNLNEGETATFSGPASVQNIVSRVTGGEPSWINGMIRSEIQDANLYFLNPTGIVFGTEAALDITGSFYAATADYLRQGEYDRFYSESVDGEILSWAAPTAFGFLGDDPGPITMEGGGKLAENASGGEYAGLAVPEGETISFAGGGIEIRGAFFVTGDGIPQSVGAKLTAPGGQIVLAGLKSSGEVDCETGGGFPVENGGSVRMHDGAVVSASAEAAGSVFIKSGSFFLSDGSKLVSETEDGNGGVIDVRAENVSIRNGGRIDASTTGKGTGAGVVLSALDSVSIENGFVKTDTYSEEDAGNGGQLTIEAANVAVSGENSWIGGESYGGGNGGDIAIHASDSVRFSDFAWIATTSTRFASGKAGNIKIVSPRFTLESGAVVESESNGTGHGGNIHIHADSMNVSNGVVSAKTLEAGGGGSIIVSGADPGLEDDFSQTISLNGPDSRIHAGAIGSGNAGSVSIYTGKLTLANGASATTSTTDTGNAGTIRIFADDVEIDDASISSSSRYGEARVFHFDDARAAEDASESLAETGREGDIMVVGDPETGRTTSYIRGPYGNYWTPMYGGVSFTVDEYAELEGLAQTGFLFEGDMVLVRDSGNGRPAHYVFDGYLYWIRMKNVYDVSDISLRNGFEALSGDITRVNAGNGETEILVRTGEEWVSLFDDGVERSAVHATGDAGNINISATDSIVVSGESEITTSCAGAFQAGKITLETGSLELARNASVSSTSNVFGNAGTIDIRADIASLAGAEITTATHGVGHAGDIFVAVSRISLDDEAAVSSSSDSVGGGAAGRISVFADDSVRMKSGSAFSTEAADTRTLDDDLDRMNGKITINAGNTIYLSGSRIESSVKSGTGNGGDIDANAEFVTMNNAKIAANAWEGRGGNIHVNAGNFVSSADSSVTASSRLGIDGEVFIESPETDVSGDLVVLPENFLEAWHWMKTPCAARSGESAGSFVVKGRDATPTAFDDWRKSPVQTDKN